MGKLATFICGMATCLSAVGQPLVDSLKNQLAASSAPDTARVGLLLDVADALVWNDPGEALGYTRKAHKLASDLHWPKGIAHARSEEHTSELQSLMRNSYAVFCLK